MDCRQRVILPLFGMQLKASDFSESGHFQRPRKESGKWSSPVWWKLKMRREERDEVSDEQFEAEAEAWI